MRLFESIELKAINCRLIQTSKCDYNLVQRSIEIIQTNIFNYIWK